ncbi:hypothetical protein P43SY_000126 [Pythium insidiosum]|uniref:RING-type domain-containing protein n=1 Tax=Pythium insidiosum TaxID=114742 RepID=A0AAD5M3E9_PYTIN|nr:hypothetical protein P43SY_000126 [Pythium insidiosum]
MSSSARDAAPDLLREYEQTLTRAIPSPRAHQPPSSPARAVGSNSSSSSAAAARRSSLSPRAVHHSPHAFDEQRPSLTTFSPRRRTLSQQQQQQQQQLRSRESDADAVAVTHATSISVALDEEQKAEVTPQMLLKATASASASTPVDRKEAASPVETGDGCLICMDEFSARRKAYPLPCTGQCTGASVHYRCIMAWLGQSGSCPLCRGPCDPLVLQPLQKLELQDMTKMALQPVPLDAGIIRCYVKQIYRGLLKPYSYELYLQGQIGTQEEDKFLLSAKRQVRSNMTANYTIHTDKDGSDAARIGRMGSNFLGTCFTMYDNGRDPQKLAKIQDAVNSDEMAQNVLQIREELGCVTYEPNRTSVGPRKMRVVIPAVDENGVSSKVVRPMSRQDRLVTRLQGGDLRDLMKFTNREPVFREDLGAYCLDFGGRVSMASVKNFQLINTDDPSMGNILQFGRVADDMFTMDFQWPLSPFQAFAICLSSCDTKLACV